MQVVQCARPPVIFYTFENTNYDVTSWLQLLYYTCSSPGCINVQHFKGQNRKKFAGAPDPTPLERGMPGLATDPTPVGVFGARLHSSAFGTRPAPQFLTSLRLYRIAVTYFNSLYCALMFTSFWQYAFFVSVGGNQWRCAQGPPKFIATPLISWY